MEHVSGPAEPLSGPIEIRDYDSAWPDLYAHEASRIRAALGERAVRVEHAGSTSVPGLPAKPVIDIVLEVRDSSDEAAYVPDMKDRRRRGDHRPRGGVGRRSRSHLGVATQQLDGIVRCQHAPMLIREAQPRDLPAIARFFRLIVDAGDTYAYPEGLDDQGIADLWMVGPPGRTVVAVNGEGEVVGSATMGPNRPGRGAHIATASFMVDPATQGQGIGRELGVEMLRWAREQGFHGVQFNAVVETNIGAVHLWQDLGFEIMTTIPEAFEHRTHGRVGLHVMYRRL